LEHGRFFTANPVYYVSGGNEDDDFYIGPSVVWQIEAGQTAGLIEFNGQGLKSLENALATKEDQVASLGGRLLGESANAGQSDNQVKLKDRNEQSLLLNVTTVLNENFTYLLQEMAAWLNDKATSKDGDLVIELGVDELVFRVNQDFLLDNAAAREFRAVTMMYQAGIHAHRSHLRILPQGGSHSGIHGDGAVHRPARRREELPEQSRHRRSEGRFRQRGGS
jgi:hypothetical protein